MPELDTMRGVAVLGVYIYHALYLSTHLASWGGAWRFLLTATWLGRLGVNLFFVLSGFLITGILLRNRRHQTFYRAFYIRRALRILPAYFLILFVLLLTRSFPTSFLLISFFFLANFAQLFGIGLVYRVLWSLAVEEQFYLFWPFVVRRLSLQKFRVCCLAIIALSPVCRFLTWHFAAKIPFRNFGLNFYTWNSLDGLACGALLMAYLYDAQISRARFRITCLLVLAAAALAWIGGLPFGLLSADSQFAAMFQIVPWNLSFTAFLGLLLLLGTGPRRDLVNIKWLQFLGYISFGLYLCHPVFLNLYDLLSSKYAVALIPSANQPGKLLLRLIAAGGASVLTAFLSRRFFEERFLQLKGRLTGSA